MNSKVFISFAAPQAAAAAGVSAALLAMGIDNRLADRDGVRPSYLESDFDSDLFDVRAVLVLRSAAADSNQQVIEDLRHARALKLKIVIVQLEPLPASGTLMENANGAKIVDAFPPLQPHLGRIGTLLKSVMNGDAERAVQGGTSVADALWGKDSGSFNAGQAAPSSPKPAAPPADLDQLKTMATPPPLMNTPAAFTPGMMEARASDVPATGASAGAAAAAPGAASAGAAPPIVPQPEAATPPQAPPPAAPPKPAAPAISASDHLPTVPFFAPEDVSAAAAASPAAGATPASGPLPPVTSLSDGIDSLRQGQSIDAPSRPGLLGRIDHYELIRKLGEGGMGIVLLARDTKTDSLVALKTMHPRYAKNKQAKHRFAVEARHMQRMNHPHVLKVLDVCDRDEGCYYVMPLIVGGSLAGLMQPDEPLLPETVLRVGRHIADALRYAHDEAGVIHRDLKPQNVLIDTGGNALLSDFGLVRSMFNDTLVDNQQRSWTVGTGPYMPPEIVAGKAGDTRADIYSFGAMLYEMACGHPPYTGQSTEEVLTKIKLGPPLPIAEANPAISPELAKVIDGCLGRELRDRYAHMADAAEDLRRVQIGEPVLGPHGAAARVQKPASSVPATAPVVTPPVQPSGRGLMWVGIAAVLAVVLACGAAISQRKQLIAWINPPKSQPAAPSTQPSSPAGTAPLPSVGTSGAAAVVPINPPPSPRPDASPTTQFASANPISTIVSGDHTSPDVLPSHSDPANAAPAKPGDAGVPPAKQDDPTGPPKVENPPVVTPPAKDPATSSPPAFTPPPQDDRPHTRDGPPGKDAPPPRKDGPPPGKDGPPGEDGPPPGKDGPPPGQDGPPPVLPGSGAPGTGVRPPPPVGHPQPPADAKALKSAIQRGDLRALRQALDSGAIDLDKPFPDGDYPLQLAIQTGQSKQAIEMIDRGASLDLRWKDGKTPIYKAAEQDEPEVIKAIAAKQVNVDTPNPTTGLTPLYAAAFARKPAALQALLDLGADLDHKCGRETPRTRVEKDGTDEMKAIVSKWDQAHPRP